MYPGSTGGWIDMVVLTRKADYALLAMAYLGRTFGKDGVSSAREVAAQYSIPPSVLMNILKTLQREGLVRSVRGPRGGYSLARPVESITLAEIVKAIEGPVRVTRCSETPDGSRRGSCERSPWCPIRGPAQVVQEKLDRVFREVTLADIVERSVPGNTATSA